MEMWNELVTGDDVAAFLCIEAATVKTRFTPVADDTYATADMLACVPQHLRNKRIIPVTLARAAATAQVSVGSVLDWGLHQVVNRLMLPPVKGRKKGDHRYFLGEMQVMAQYPDLRATMLFSTASMYMTEQIAKEVLGAVESGLIRPIPRRSAPDPKNPLLKTWDIRRFLINRMYP